MYFTQDDFKKIHEWLKRNSVKDSEFPLATSENGTEYITMVQNGKNVILPFNTFKSMVGGVVNVIAPPTITSKNNMITITASPANKIYYTLGEGNSPDLDKEGNPVNTDTTHTYERPFSYEEDTIVKAVAIFTNSEGKLLISEISEHEAVYEVTLQAPTIEFSKNENNLVTITNPNNNEDSLVYYTTDGSDPRDSESRKLYEANPFRITYDVTTIKAVVLLGNTYSEVTDIEVQYVKKSVDKPRAKGLTYNGSEQNAFDVLNNDYYTLEEGSTTKGINAGIPYVASFTLRDTNTTEWSDGDTNATIQVRWSIAQKQATITWNTPSGNFGSKEIGDEISFSATVDNGIVTFYRNGTSEPIGSPYILTKNDIGNLTKIVAKNTSLDDPNNYSKANDVTKTITVSEKSIPWQYGNKSDEYMGEILPKYDFDFNRVTIEDVYDEDFITYGNNLIEDNYEEYTPENQYLILSYPKEDTMRLVPQSEHGADLDNTFFMGMNEKEAAVVAIYQVSAGGKLRITKKKKN